MIAFFAASQDIVVDALRINTLSDNDLKEGSSLYQLGYRIGMLITGAAIIALSSHISWSFCYQISALFIIMGILALLLLDEPQIKEIKKINLQHLLFAPFTDFIQRHKIWFKLLLFIVLYKICNALLGRMAAPFYINIGFSKEQIALISGTFGPFITMAGVFLGGILMVKLGYFKSMMYLGFIEILTSLAFATLAIIGPNILAFTSVIIFDNIVGGMGGAVFVAFLSSLCSKHHSATQYALLTSLTMVVLSSLTAVTGYMVDFLGWPKFFILTGITMLPALFLLKSMMKEIK